MNCASSSLVLAWLVSEIDKTKTDKKLDKAIKMITGVFKHSLVYARQHNGFIVNVNCIAGPLQVNCHGFVTNLHELINREAHSSVATAWGLQWQSMRGEGGNLSLSSDWSSPNIALSDVLMFCLLASRTRRSQCKKPWKGPSETFLTKLLQHLIFFLADIIADFVKLHKAENPVYGQRLPSRTLAPATRTPHYESLLP